jgi:hypothetical protein
MEQLDELLPVDAPAGRRRGGVSRACSAGWFAARLAAYFAASFALSAGVFLLAHI